MTKLGWLIEERIKISLQNDFTENTFELVGCCLCRCFTATIRPSGSWPRKTDPNPPSPIFHPNIQGARSNANVQAYISKYDDYIEHRIPQVDGRSAQGCQSAIAEVYAEAINSGNKSDFLRIIKEKDPKSFCLQFRNLYSNAERIFQPPIENYVSPWVANSFRITDDMAQWIENYVLVSKRRAEKERLLTEMVECGDEQLIWK